ALSDLWKRQIGSGRAAQLPGLEDDDAAVVAEGGQGQFLIRPKPEGRPLWLGVEPAALFAELGRTTPAPLPPDLRQGRRPDPRLCGRGVHTVPVLRRTARSGRARPLPAWCGSVWTGRRPRAESWWGTGPGAARPCRWRSPCPRTAPSG